MFYRKFVSLVFVPKINFCVLNLHSRLHLCSVNLVNYVENVHGSRKLKVCLIGSGNWGMVVAKIVGNNVLKMNEVFESHLPMYVKKELIGDQDLAEIINCERRNQKYMPYCSVPPNVFASSSLESVVDGTDILIFVLPHEYMYEICNQLIGRVKSTAMAISLVKGLDVTSGKLDLISNIVKRRLNIDCAVLMGANLANEVALEMFSEATIGCRDQEKGRIFKTLFQNSYFRISLVEDQQTVELCGALKNIVALGAGFIDGLKLGHSTKAAVIRLGLLEIVEFSRRFLGDVKMETFMESCGVADLVSTCYNGRNKKIAEAYVLNPDNSMEDLERKMLCGQKLQGPATAAEVNKILKKEKEEFKFPIFTAVHKICRGEEQPTHLIECLKNQSDCLE